MRLRDLPSVDHLLQHKAALSLIALFGRPLTVQAIRENLDFLRSTAHDDQPAPNAEQVLNQAESILNSWLSPTLIPVINATGVIIHTNLGRAPLSHASRKAMSDLSVGYSTLEYDIERGKRGKRETHPAALLCRLTNAEAALVVNNNAAAILLALTALAKRKEVLISRSQLIEIGGGFRIPEVMRQSGAKLVEVGTTNRTHLHDFEQAISPRTKLILCAHHSNFKIVGYTSEPSPAELVALGRRHAIPVINDLGSGALLDTAAFGLAHEPTIQESLRAGFSLVAFSGDKLLGGPQAGILLGNKAIIDRLRRHPLARAVRPDKLCLAALAATLRHYLKDEALQTIPIWQMIAVPEEILKARADVWRSTTGHGEIVSGRSTIGGGSLPDETLPTWLLALPASHPNALAAQLRRGHPPIIARIEKKHVILDPRTVLPEQDEVLISQLKKMATLG